MANKYLSLEELEDLKSNKGSFIDSNKYETLLNIFNKKGIKDLEDYKNISLLSMKLKINQKVFMRLLQISDMTTL